MQSATGNAETPAGASPAGQLPNALVAGETPTLQPAGASSASPPPNAQEAPSEAKDPAVPSYQLAEEGWEELVKAAAKIQTAANAIKQTAHSVDGYNIERALNKHKPHLMAEHLAGLREHRKTKNL
ncbi:MAG: hypothetical protein ABSE73_28580 [Planctomycetota bacterium]